MRPTLKKKTAPKKKTTKKTTKKKVTQSPTPISVYGIFEAHAEEITRRVFIPLLHQVIGENDAETIDDVLYYLHHDHDTPLTHSQLRQLLRSVDATLFPVMRLSGGLDNTVDIQLPPAPPPAHMQEGWVPPPNTCIEPTPVPGEETWNPAATSPQPAPQLPTAPPQNGDNPAPVRDLFNFFPDPGPPHSGGGAKMSSNLGEAMQKIN